MKEEERSTIGRRRGSGKDGMKEVEMIVCRGIEKRRKEKRVCGSERMRKKK